MKITVDLSDAAVADLRAVQLKLRQNWRYAPGLKDHDVSEVDAVRTALSVFMAVVATDDLAPKQGHA